MAQWGSEVIVISPAGQVCYSVEHFIRLEQLYFSQAGKNNKENALTSEMNYTVHTCTYYDAHCIIKWASLDSIIDLSVLG